MVAPSQFKLPERENIRDRIADIEHALDSNQYRPGIWRATLADARRLSREDRRALAEDISRVSRKLHLREPRRRASFTTALILEGVFALIGGVLLLLANQNQSNTLGIIGMLLWVMTLQPLVKVGVGFLLSVEYEYGFLFGVEPRFKMRFGDYLAAPRWARIVLHLSGTIGSPLGSWLATVCLNKNLWIAIDVSWVAFWLVVAVNAASMIAALAGVRKVGPFAFRDSSGGSAMIELKEALEIETA